MIFFMVLVWFMFSVMDGSVSPTSADISKVIDLAALDTLLPISQALSGWMVGTIVTATLLCGHFGMCLWLSHIVSLSPFYCLYLIKLLCFA